jgi:hypothetical protein
VCEATTVHDLIGTLEYKTAGLSATYQATTHHNWTNK